MGKNRLEAFFDGVVAIIITIMVLEMKVPHGDSIATLSPLIPVILSYVLSFVYLGIYWNNHHHMLHASCKVSGFRLHALGQSSSAVLAVTHTLYNRLDGGESLFDSTGSALWFCTFNGCHCLLDIATKNHRITRRRFYSQESHRS